MELYNSLAYETARNVTQTYSTSFSAASSLFATDVKPHIYAIYGLVRIADEIIDTYRGNDALRLLDELEREVFAAIERDYSPNIIVHAFSQTASRFDIGAALIEPFFRSMKADYDLPAKLSRKQYNDYIYGSAEVIGLMCLKVFAPDAREYSALEPGARRLGAAFQKVNFLRDFADDHNRLGRIYFPDVTFATFDTAAKTKIENDIMRDFAAAKTAVAKLPKSASPAVSLAYNYYEKLFQKLQKTSAEQIKTTRLRIPNAQKLMLYAKARIAS